MRLQVKALRGMTDPASSLPFVQTILSSLRKEVDGQATLLGFIGTPWTLAAYAMEGKSDKDCKQTKVRAQGIQGLVTGCKMLMHASAC